MELLGQVFNPTACPGLVISLVIDSGLPAAAAAAAQKTPLWQLRCLCCMESQGLHQAPRQQVATDPELQTAPTEALLKDLEAPQQ